MLPAKLDFLIMFITIFMTHFLGPLVSQNHRKKASGSDEQSISGSLTFDSLKLSKKGTKTISHFFMHFFICSQNLLKGRGRIEKTEIVEMAIKHIKHLHQLMDAQRNGASGATDESADGAADRSATTGSNWQCPQEVESFRNGFNECTAEAIHFLVDKESYPPGKQNFWREN